MTPEIKRQLGAKRAEVSHLIAHELRMSGYTGKSLGQKIGVSGVLVTTTIRGERHNPIVLDALRSLGISEKLLFDPKKMEVA